MAPFQEEHKYKGSELILSFREGRVSDLGDSKFVILQFRDVPAREVLYPVPQLWKQEALPFAI